jgi:hypothetical protein
MSRETELNDTPARLLKSDGSHGWLENGGIEHMARRPAEQRVSPRIPVSSPAVMKWSEEQLTGYVEVVNLNGMYVAAPRFPALGEFVDMIFALPGNPKNFRVRASVVSTQKATDGHSGFGARFERPPHGFLEAIRALEKEH